MIIHRIEDIVCDYTGIDKRQLQVKTRKRNIVFSRQLVWYFARIFTKMSTTELAMRYGKDHATCLHGTKNIRNLIETDKYIRNDAEELKKDIKNLENVFKTMFGDRREELEMQLFHNCI